MQPPVGAGRRHLEQGAGSNPRRSSRRGAERGGRSIPEPDCSPCSDGRHRGVARRSDGICRLDLPLDEGLGSNAALLRTIDGLMQCSLLVNADLSTERILQQIMEEAKAIVGAEVASVFLVDAPRQELFSRVNSTGAEIRVPVGSGIVGHVAARGEAVITDPRRLHGSSFPQGGGPGNRLQETRSILCAPLKTRRGSVMGVVELINKTSDGALLRSSPEADGHEGFTLDDVQFVQVFASQAALAVAGSEALRGA
ncbi:unnamed protein product, partial [Prorocentrum cordatum]